MAAMATRGTTTGLAVAPNGAPTVAAQARPPPRAPIRVRPRTNVRASTARRPRIATTSGNTSGWQIAAAPAAA